MLSRAFTQVTLLALFVRIILLIYGEWQDRYLEVKYTDVDYWVFSDAAKAIAGGKSPFSRHTYRYTPLLAALLLPNGWYDGWGKILFSLCDLLAGYLIYLFLLRSTNPSRAAKLVAVSWLLNPMIFTISTRGNAESLLSCLVLAGIYFLTCRRYFLGGLFYGAAVHFKIFPIIYGVAILTYLLTGKSIRSVNSPPMSPKLLANVTPTPSPSSSPDSSPKSDTSKIRKRKAKQLQKEVMASALATPSKINTVKLTTVKDRFSSLMIFAIGAIISLGVFTGICYHFYGKEYLEEAIFYHIYRKDHRHNFSPYFYLFYTEANLSLPTFFELFTFIPQLIFFIATGLKYGKKDLPFACFLITFVFVAFNKVITSQYFIWHLSLFPMAYVGLHNISKTRWLIIGGIWFGAQALWLNLAYKLEFLGINTFVPLWAASITFLIANTWIAGQFIKYRIGPEVLHAGPGIITLNNAVL